MEITTGLIIILIILGFSVSLVNNAFGMGYGMISTPVLLFLGFSPLVVVPASLLSQTVLGFAGTFFHSIYKNVDLETKKQQNAKIAMVFTLFGLIGTTVAIFIAISLNEIFMISYIAIMVSIIGFFLLKDVSFQFSWRYIFLISSIAAFNQALVGGGYGPLATSGQLMSGRGHKEAAATSIFSQAFLSGYGFLLYFVFTGFSNVEFLITLLVTLIFSGITATPLGAIIAKNIPEGKGKPIIGYLSICLGFATFLRLIFY